MSAVKALGEVALRVDDPTFHTTVIELNEAERGVVGLH